LIEVPLTLNSTLNEYKNVMVGKSEEKLLLQQVKAAIEEGVTRGQIRAEQELELIKERAKNRP